ncbi:MAG: hypothetical protein LBQ54_06670 [Planctomycetaceae bacterium]|jgi:hypothetical protein|nr:hypothetical protein [Planctomycetaceae bacterium]
MQNGYDPKLPYKRFRHEEETNVFYEMRQLSYRIRHIFDFFEEHIPNTNIFFIGFAGKIYPFFEDQENSDQPDYILINEQIVDKYSLILLERVSSNNRYWWFQNLRREKGRKECLSDMRKSIMEVVGLTERNELLSLFEKFKTAIFVYKPSTNKIVINERLNQYRFQKVLPPNVAFQELEMYVGSCLTQPVMEEPPLSDKIKAEIHGFDKHSFRKDKTKNRK